MIKNNLRIRIISLFLTETYNTYKKLIIRRKYILTKPCNLIKVWIAMIA